MNELMLDTDMVMVDMEQLRGCLEGCSWVGERGYRVETKEAERERG